jgi:hypothetical protein
VVIRHRETIVTRLVDWPKAILTQAVTMITVFAINEFLVLFSSSLHAGTCIMAPVSVKRLLGEMLSAKNCKWDYCSHK